jgi:hypothetical protein
VERDASNAADTPKKWVRLITQQARKNYKWFYLPEQRDVGVVEKSAVDFRLTFSLCLPDVRQLARAGRRAGRLNSVASAHFRERIAEFFRRYAYDEWYPLDQDEFDVYAQGLTEAPERYPWQE